ncbi:MAG TPA: hypothetical protein VKX35_05575 [Fermentimonas sp.]|nr:hypothetical protein [Fermentimonas sp.]
MSIFTKKGEFFFRSKDKLACEPASLTIAVVSQFILSSYIDDKIPFPENIIILN